MGYYSLCIRATSQKEFSSQFPISFSGKVGESLNKNRRLLCRNEYSLRFVITASPLETVAKKMKSRDHYLIILQGEFIAICKEDQMNNGLCSQAISK